MNGKTITPDEQKKLKRIMNTMGFVIIMITLGSFYADAFLEIEPKIGFPFWLYVILSIIVMIIIFYLLLILKAFIKKKTGINNEKSYLSFLYWAAQGLVFSFIIFIFGLFAKFTFGYDKLLWWTMGVIMIYFMTRDKILVELKKLKNAESTSANDGVGNESSSPESR